MSDTTGSPTRRKFIYSITAGDAQVRKNLNDHFDQVARNFNASRPQLTEHKRQVDPMLSTVPAAIWSGNPKEARIELKKYVGTFTKEQKEALSDVSAATAELYNKPNESKAPRIPSVVKLIQLLQEMSMDREAKIDDFDERIDQIRDAIHDNASTKKERKERRKSMQALDVETPTKLTKAQKKKARLSYDPAKMVAIPKLAEGCVTKNPEFHIFSYYKFEVAKQQEGESHAKFDAVFEKRVLSKFDKLKGASLETVKSQLNDLVETTTSFAALMSDPYKMLDPNTSRPADQGQLMPVLLKMVIQARIQREIKLGVYRQTDLRPIFKIPETPYLESDAFRDDYHQLQISLNHQTAKSVLTKTLSEKASRRRTEKEREKDEVTASPGSKKSPKDKEKRRKLNKKSATTSTAATTPITTTTTTTTTLVGTPNNEQVKLSSTPGMSTMPNALQMVYNGAQAFIGGLNDEFGPEVVLATFMLINASRLAGVTNSTVDDSNVLGQVDQLSNVEQVVELANLSPDQVDKLVEAGKELKSNLTLLGTTKEAVALSSFLLNISKRLDRAPKPSQLGSQATSE